MAAEPEHNVMELNNYLMRQGGTARLSWDVKPEGPKNHTLWVAKAMIDQIELGVGTHTVKKEAKEIAAKQAYKALAEDYHKRTDNVN